MALVLGIDIGTASAKAVLVRTDGTLLARVDRAHRTDSPHPGWVEHDPRTVWWDGLTGLTRQAAARVPSGERIAAVGISGIGPCLLPCDAHGEPLRAAILYGVDTRAGEQIAAQKARYGEQRVLERCRSPLTSQAIGPKLAWLREREPEVWGRTERWFMASNWLVHRLTGAYVLDHHSASQSVPLYDRAAGAWITEWCEQIAPGLEWPRLVWPSDVVGEVTAAAAAATGLPAGVPVVAGTVDAWAEATAAGVREPGDVMVMYGSTMFLLDVVGEPLGDPRLWGTTGAFPGTHCLAAGMATSGAVTGWLSELTGASFGALTEEAAALPPGAEGLLMLPYFAGERTPLFDPDARGLVLGLTLRHGRGHLYRAALEATAFGVRHNLEAIEAAGGDLRQLVAVGGGARELWTRIVSDVTGREQQVPRYTVGAAYGDAVFAALGAGLAGASDVAGWNPVAARVAPDPSTGAVYGRLYGMYRDLYPATSDAAHTLAALQNASSPQDG